MIGLVFLVAGCREAGQAFEKVKKLAVEAKEEAATPALPCGTKEPENPPNACLSGTIQCGQTIEGTTVGGDSNWDDDFYAAHFCFPAGDDRSGPERAYLFKAPANQDIDIKLQSDCVDLDVAAIAWTYEGTCPGTDHLIPECEGDAKPGGGRLRLNTFKERDYLLAVEGKKGATGPFRLTVACTPLGGH